MNYSKSEFMQHTQSWKKLLNDYCFPTWDDLPSFDLYMDQVIALMNDYLSVFVPSGSTQASAMTPPMINNYVKLKVMPAPRKKKYSKIHLAYLIMISSLKQALNIPSIQKIIPLLDNENDIRLMYEAFSENQQKTFSYIAGKISSVAEPVFESESGSAEKMHNLTVQIALSANIFKVMTEDIISSANADDKND